jgi:hypothetical protein
MSAGFVWLASYPKSGNTWLRLFLESALQGGAEIDINEPRARSPTAALRSAFDHLLDVDSSDLLVEEIERARPALYRAWAATLVRPLAVKVHDAWSRTDGGEPLFPADVTLAAFYIVRDPRDVAVSLADHFARPLDEIVALMAKPDASSGQIDDRSPERQLHQRLTTWSGHVESWLDSGLALDLLRYEDVLAEPYATLGAVARKLDASIDDESIRGAIEATRFGRLQEQERRGGFVERVVNPGGFFRRGGSGGWRERLTAAQVARIEDDHRAVMQRLGYI